MLTVAMTFTVQTNPLGARLSMKAALPSVGALVEK